MKKNNLLKGAFAVLLLSSPLAGAKTDYPASDFKPTVQYQDAEYIAKSKASSASAGQSQQTPPDAQYPATSFEPKVLYKDSDYKHSVPKATASRSTASSANASVETSTAPVASATEKKVESKSNYLIALVVLGLVGFVLSKKRAPATPVARQYAAYTPDTTGSTGVDKYLQRTQGPVATGVARYLEKQVVTVKEKAVATGVAKYLEKKVIESETGVSKYLRSKG